MWRCISRLDYGKKYCSDSPTIMEDKLQEAIVRAVNKFNEQDTATYKALMRATISEALGLNGDPEEVDMLERSGSCSIWQFPIKRIPSSKRCTKGGIFCLRGLEDGMLGEGRGGAKRKLCHKPMKIHFSSQYPKIMQIATNFGYCLTIFMQDVILTSRFTAFIRRSYRSYTSIRTAWMRGRSRTADIHPCKPRPFR